MAGNDGHTLHSSAVLIIILVSYLMIVLDLSIVITALPEIQKSMGFSATGLSWVQNIYMLVFGGLLLLGARTGDILGRRRMFIVGMGLFTAASLGIGLAPSALWLLIARALQGVGAAILAPATLSLLMANFSEGPERTRAVAYYGAVAGIGASVGLVIGGIITSLISWRFAFFINVPIGIVMILAAVRYITETKGQPGHFDLAGAISSTIGMSMLVYGIINSATAGWNDPVTIAALTAGILLLTLFVLNEWRAQQPIIPLRLFKSRERVGAYAARMLFLGGMWGFWFFTTLFLQDVYGYSPLEAGIAFLPMTIINFVVAMAVPKFTRQFGNVRLLAGGLLITMIGMAWLSRLSADTSYLTGIALPMLVIGIGQGASLGPLTASGIAGVNKEDAGAASGLVNVAHQLGGSLGLSILVTVFAAAGSSMLNAQQLLAHRIAISLEASAVMLVIASIIVILLIVQPLNIIQRYRIKKMSGMVEN